MAVYLHGLGHCHPETEITNSFLEALDIGTSTQWVLDRVGIRSRRTVLSLEYLRATRNADPRAAAEASSETHASLGIRAAKLALQRAGVGAHEIGLVIGGGSAPNHLTPGEACHIAAGLGVSAPAFDVASACTSFFVPLHLLSMMAAERVPEFVLVVVPEVLTSSTDYRDRTNAVLFGDGAVAAVLSTKHVGRAEIIGSTLASEPSAFDKVSITRHTFFEQEGQSVQKFAIKHMAMMAKQLKASHHRADREWSFVGHQANFRMLERVCEAAEVSASRHFHNVADYGNTGAAGSASVLSQRWESFTALDDVCVTGVGGGLTWASYLLRFLR